MRLLHTIPTPWTPYSVMFSRDGNRIAIGGGSWYGDGGVMLADILTGKFELFSGVDLEQSEDEGSPAVSGVCFSADDRHLAASTWTARQHGGPTHLFEVSDLKLMPAALLIHSEPMDSCPTGVLLHGKYTIVRNHLAEPRDVIAVIESPQELGIRADKVVQHLTSSNIVAVRANAITGGRGLQRTPWPARGLTPEEWQSITTFRESGKPVAEGLVSIALNGQPQQVQLIPVAGCRRITAIVATPAGDSFVTGGLDGELDQWSWKGHWEQKQLRPKTENWEIQIPNVIWATYESNSIVGICYLCDAQQCVSVTAGGELGVMDGPALVGAWQLPVPGSPRSLAAHPAKAWVAVGIKQGGFANPKGTVGLVDIDSFPRHGK